MSNTETVTELRDDIASTTESATEIISQIARLIAAGKFASAIVRTDYLQGRIRSMERAQKRIAKLEAHP